jgi:hypothetical protein
MKNKLNTISEKFSQYHFEINHLLVIFIILILFQLLIGIIQKISLKNFLVDNQEWYQKDFAERLSNLTATSMELILETAGKVEDEDKDKIIQAFNIMLSQQKLQKHVQEVCILLTNGDEITAVDNGRVLYSYIFEGNVDLPTSDENHDQAIQKYLSIQEEIKRKETTHSEPGRDQTFHVFVPFVPKGEYFGALYMKSAPEFGFVTSGILAGNNETSVIFTALIFFGLLTMFFISSYTVKERDQAQHLLFQTREKQIEEQVHHKKEMLFTKRIYHTHHKAEKVMGFIKDDLKALTITNFKKVNYRINKYANFISRVIYDMKWFDPPLQTIRNPVFQTNINEVIEFILENIFTRVSKGSTRIKFDLDLDPSLLLVHINEYVIWEIIEPLIQNGIEHGNKKNSIIKITTKCDFDNKESKIYISDNGCGIIEDLLRKDENGVKAIFLENVSTKINSENSGYGCYIAYEIATQRCGWNLDVKNMQNSGAQFIITIPHLK